MTFINLKNSDILTGPVVYTSVRGDVVDEKLERFLKKYDVKIPVRRINENGYLFGTK